MLSILVPCYNEELLVKSSFKEIIKSLKSNKIKKYEIILIDDGSVDKSLTIVEKLQEKNKNIKIIKNKKNYGMGYNFFTGIKKSKGKYLILLPADNSHPASEISKMLNYIGSDYDLVTTYYSNHNKSRSIFRNLFTLAYTPVLNFIFGTNFKYFNGLTLYKTKDLKSLKFKNSSFSYQIEIFVYLFHKRKLKTKVIPTILKDRKKGSKAFRVKNSVQVIFSIIRIFYQSIFYRISNFLNQ